MCLYSLATPLLQGSSRRGRRRYIEGGLAEALERVVQKEEMEVTFWEQRVKTLQDSEVGEYHVCYRFLHLHGMTVCTYCLPI